MYANGNNFCLISTQMIAKLRDPINYFNDFFTVEDDAVLVLKLHIFIYLKNNVLSNLQMEAT